MAIDAATLSGLKALWEAAFGDTDEEIDAFFRTGFSPERCRYLIREGKVVCALYWFDCQWKGRPLAYIYALATLPDFRRQGLAGLLLEQTHTHLAQKGYYGAILKPAEGLFSYYERQGYTTCGYVDTLYAEADQSPLPVKALSPEAYAARRRQYLPENSVIQEGDALRYLAAFSSFWEGPACVFCTDRNRQTMFEFLGARQNLPGVLNALGMASAEPVTPGHSEPFLMYHSLADTSECGPAYLGLSLE